MRTHMQEEIMKVLRMHPHTFIYFCDPITVNGGRVRDYAVGVFSYLLNVHVFMLSNEVSATNTKIYATVGPHERSQWHAMDTNDLDFCQLYHGQLKMARSLFQVYMEKESADEPDERRA